MSASLHAYRHARVIVQNLHTSAEDAARAMKTNDIGCVLVSDGRKVVGIVTDRDLALRVVAEGRSARNTELGAIMSTPIAALDIDAPHEDAVRIMRERNIRRLPLVRGRRVLGVVTVDDLILERSATLGAISGIVRAQVIEAGPARTRPFDEWTSLARRQARALGTKAKLLERVKKSAGLTSNKRAEMAVEAVLEVLVRSVDAPVASALIARLPVAFRGRLRELGPGDASPGATRTQCEVRIARELGLDRPSAGEVVSAVGAALSPILRAGDPIGRLLPADVRAILIDQPRGQSGPRRSAARARSDGRSATSRKKTGS